MHQRHVMNLIVIDHVTYSYQVPGVGAKYYIPLLQLRTQKSEIYNTIIQGLLLCWKLVHDTLLSGGGLNISSIPPSLLFIHALVEGLIRDGLMEGPFWFRFPLFYVLLLSRNVLLRNVFEVLVFVS